MRNRIVLALCSVIAVFGFALPAGASVHPHTLPPSIWNIWTEFGIQNCVGVGAGGDNAGQPVIEKSNHANCSTMTDGFQGTDIHGHPEYLWSFNSGNYMAATNDCTKVTIKSSASSNGTVWILVFDINGHAFLYSRYCNNTGIYNNGLSADNTAGNQWDVASTGYMRLILQNLEG
jgi:hypothetical protein